MKLLFTLQMWGRPENDVELNGKRWKRVEIHMKKMRKKSEFSSETFPLLLMLRFLKKSWNWKMIDALRYLSIHTTQFSVTETGQKIENYWFSILHNSQVFWKTIFLSPISFSSLSSSFSWEQICFQSFLNLNKFQLE